MLEFPSHPDVDLALELLCTLPVEPDSIPLNDLVTDFGFSNQGSILSLIDKLRDRDYNILSFYRHNGTHPSKKRIRCIAIAKPHSITALADCERYWHRIHGNHDIESDDHSN